NNIAQEQGGKCLSTEYKNTNTPMHWHCIQGHECLEACKEIVYSKGGFASFNSIKHAKTWCPYCLNKHENLCREVITKILGPPSVICKPNFLKTPEYLRGLELDIYYPQYRFAIEIKRELCDENWFVLIEIWYYKDPHIIIPKYLKELGLID
ncbi:979_t:CDS:2, partial [Racocetra persica]